MGALNSNSLWFALNNLPKAILVLAFLFVPQTIEADFEIVPGLSAGHAGAFVIEDVSFDQSEMSVVIGDDLTEATSDWTLHFLQTFPDPIDASRGAFVLGKMNEENFVMEKPYAIAHAPIPGDDGDPETAESAMVSFPDLLLGDPSAPSGVYGLFVYIYPEFKYVYDQVLDEDFEEPYIEEDFLNWFQWNVLIDPFEYEGEIPETYSPEDSRQLMFDYIASTGPVYQKCCSSVVFLPGLKGSVLKSGDDTLWPTDFGSSFAFSNDIQQLAIDPETGESVNSVTVEGILNSFDVPIGITTVSTPIYKGFSSFMDSLTAIDSETGTSTIKAWESFAYDWRFSPEKVIADENMVARLEELAASSDTGQVSIVAHSMGGLIGKELIRQLEEQGKEELIDSFVMVGSPQLGTPQAIASLLHGDDEGILGGLLVSASDVREVAQNMPSAYNLLPSSRYFDIVSDAPILFNENAGFTEEWREYWDSSSLGRYLDFFSFATGGGVARTKPSSLFLKIPEVLNPDLVAEAQALHVEIDSYDFPDSIRVVQVAGWGVPTTKAIE